MLWNFVSSNRECVPAAARDWEQRNWVRFPPVHNEANDDSVPMPHKKTAGH